ncbi:MAG: hypothetical protein AAGK10_16895 [Cyanobacteria bacterium J06555_3]
MTQAIVAPAEINFAQIQSDYASRSPGEILEYALNKFDNIAISFSGAEDVILIDRENLKIFTHPSGKID